ncbi:hypothetical protein BGZ47_001918, partial [Haplosporangium gracile]
MKTGVLKSGDCVLHVMLGVQELIDTEQHSEPITVNAAKVGELAELSVSLGYRQLVQRVRGTYDTENIGMMRADSILSCAIAGNCVLDN